MSSCGFEREIERGTGRGGVSRKEESEICWKQTLMNIAHAWVALVASWGETRVKDVQVKHTHLQP